MNSPIDDIDALLSPIAEENPAGENLRYTSVYDEIQEARKADDRLDRGEWQRDLKMSDWPKVVSISVEALKSKSKDLQIAAWLTEGWVRTEGFSGLCSGLKVINRLLGDYWETLYPEIEDGDLEFRAGPIEFVNDKLWVAVKEISLTDNKVSNGYSWFNWQESRQVGYEADTHNQHGDVDEKKKEARDQMVAGGRLTAEDFDSAVAHSSRAYYEALGAAVASSKEEFQKLDGLVDEKFGSEAPRLAEMREALEDCDRLVSKILKEKREAEPDPPDAEKEVVDGLGPTDQEVGERGTQSESVIDRPTGVPDVRSAPIPATGPDGEEATVWNGSLEKLRSSGIESALSFLYSVSSRAPSVREKNRYQLLMAKLCLIADRPDLAKPIMEKLYSLIEEFNLERWESPMWIADVMDTLYKCLTAGQPTDDEVGRAQELLRRLCTTDVTKAISHGN